MYYKRFQFVHQLLRYAILILTELFEKKSKNYNQFFPRKTGNVVVLTGGTTGIGKATVKRLLKCNATIVLGCPPSKDSDAIVKEAKNEGVTTENVKVYPLDLSCPKSVSDFAEQVRRDFNEIHYLINNGGWQSKSKTATCECTFAQNYLAPIYLTHLLLPLLKRGGKPNDISRIIMVSSSSYQFGNMNFQNITERNNNNQWQENSTYNLAQVLFSNYLNRLLQSESVSVRCYSANTGIFQEIFKNTPLYKLPLMYKKEDYAAVVILYTCFLKELESKGGSYISNCKIQMQNDMTKDAKLQEKLFNYSLDMLKV